MKIFLVDAVVSLRGAWPGIGQALSWLVPLVWIGWYFALALLLLLAPSLHWLVGHAGASQHLSAAPARTI